MEGEQFSLCWNNFHNNLSAGFNSLLKDEDLVDVTIAAGGKFLKAHKAILSVCSPFFKELFRANPSTHPIVILPDVNYNSLASLLQFMYQGEVSVSQEEIPMFMRVAEMLKVKGLTDNNSQESNGVGSRSPFNSNEPRPLIKRPRPIKKLIKPMQQPLRPLEPTTSPKPSTSPQIQPTVGPPPPKKFHQHDISDQPISLKKPKEEPPDHHDNEDSIASNSFEENMDLSHLIETKLGPSEGLSQWQKAGDSSTPGGGLMLMRSGRGQLVLIHNGHIYIHCDTRNNLHMWVCVKKKTLNCDGCLTTLNGPVLINSSGHNHPQLQSVIQRLQVPSSSISPELMLQ